MASERLHVFLLERAAGRNRRVVVWDTQDVSVGRAPENDVVVEDAEASRRHADFVREEQGFCVRNMSLSNPTYVNDQPVETRTLRNRDVVRIAETEFVFCQVTRNPATLGLPLEYASQLKGFGPKLAAGDGEATVLGLMDTLGEAEDDSFVVRPAGDFEHDLHGVERPQTRNLDLELDDQGLDELEVPRRAPERPMAAWTLDEQEAAPATLALTLEIEGLTDAQRASLEALMGKVFELPELRIRLKGRDLG